MIKTTAPQVLCITLFSTFLWCPLHGCKVKSPNLMFYGYGMLLIDCMVGALEGLGMASEWAVRESGFRNPRNFYLCNPEPRKYLPVESGIQLKESEISLMIEIRDPNSTYKFANQCLESGIHGDESRLSWIPLHCTQTKISNQFLLFFAYTLASACSRHARLRLTSRHA